MKQRVTGKKTPAESLCAWSAKKLRHNIKLGTRSDFGGSSDPIVMISERALLDDPTLTLEQATKSACREYSAAVDTAAGIRRRIFPYVDELDSREVGV